jgi:predicted amidophosphoribosyltransferase
MSHCLRRVRPTGHQAWRSHDERRLAMCDAFTAKDVPAHVLLIDDVATTVSTLDACAQVLKSAGATQVHGLAIALG